MSPSAATLLRTARQQAGLSQRRLAERANTSQSVIARIELGESSPSWATLERLLAAAGFEMRASLSPLPVANSHMLADVRRILSLSPADRLAEVANVSRFDALVKRA